VVTDNDLRASMREKGFLQAARFSWQRCARGVLEVLERVAAATGGGVGDTL